MAEKILIVDDDVDSLKLISLMLKRQGYEVAVAESGGKALKQAVTESPSLIILDVMMPDMNGLDVCRSLRADPVTTDIPIIMFTAKTLIDDKVKGFEAGADDYLTKPTHPAELANRVKSVLQRKGGGTPIPAPPTPQEAPVSKITKLQPAPAPAKAGGLMGVLGVKGGVGTTTVALNVAAALLRNGKEPVVSDMRPGTGAMGLMLGHDSDGFVQLLGDEFITPDTVSSKIITLDSGLKALLSSSNPHDAAIDFPVDKPMKIIEMVRRFGDPTIVDLGSGMDHSRAAILEKVDKLLFVIESTAVGLEMAKQQLVLLDNMIGAARIHVIVVNRSQSTLPWHEAENRLNREVKAIISPAPELAFQSGEQAKPMVMLQPTAMVSGQFVKLAGELK